MSLPKTEEDRRLLASILMHEEEELTPETVEGAVRALRRIYLRRRLEEVQIGVAASGASVGGKTGAFAGKGAFEAGFDGSGTGRGGRDRRPEIRGEVAGNTLERNGSAPSKELAGKEIRRRITMGDFVGVLYF